MRGPRHLTAFIGGQRRDDGRVDEVVQQETADGKNSQPRLGHFGPVLQSTDLMKY